MSSAPPDPQTAERDEIAEWCGIRHPGTLPDERVPVEIYRSGGVVTCERSGQQPDPPWIVVANYELPDGRSAVLCHDACAEVLADAYGLEEGEALVLTLHRAGWTAQDIADDWQPKGYHAADAPELLSSATATVSD